MGILRYPFGSEEANGFVMKNKTNKGQRRERRIQLYLKQQQLLQARTVPVGGSHEGYVLKSSHPLILRINEVCICMRTM